MIMMDRHRRLSEPLRWGRREKVALAAVMTVLALAVIGLGAYALTSGSRARAGCIDLTFASTMGGARLYACGTRARAVCASPGPYSGIADSLRVACRHAGYPFGAHT
jgi:hypothetical protein